VRGARIPAAGPQPRMNGSEDCGGANLVHEWAGVQSHPGQTSRPQP
jgi:hypothetical protein